MYTANIKKLPRTYLPANFVITTWQNLQPYFTELLNRNINTVAQLQLWLANQSELEAAISEDACWRQIRMTCDTQNKTLEDAFTYFVTEIQPQMQPLANALNQKLLAHPLLNQLNQPEYYTFLRTIKKSTELFCAANIPLQAELAVLQQQYGAIAAKMTVSVNDKEYTLQQATQFLQNPNRAIRQEVYHKIQQRRLQDADALNQLFDKLIQLRHQIAINAGFTSYTQYRFKELGRFDYGAAECTDFHNSVKQHVLPLVNQIYAAKKQKLGVSTLHPWDVDAEPEGTQPLKPFTTGADLLHKTITCFTKLQPFFGQCLQKMQTLQHFDLESRPGKAPGGYNCPLPESGAPFIFMNAAGQMQDVTTMVHEGGHAIHSFLAHPLALTGFKEYPMEIAEVASMAMELFSMDEWESFFDNPTDLTRAKQHQLERVITIFPWIAIIDKFQHWLYSNPTHTTQQRSQAWQNITTEFTDDVLDYTGLEAYRANNWQRQLHLFEVPFYYIEYGIAQLGAIGMWQQYKQNKQQALQNYCNALALGGTKTLPQLYQAAGLQFNFSSAHIKNLMQFVATQMQQL
jgi:oligoendopeptidase F